MVLCLSSILSSVAAYRHNRDLLHTWGLWALVAGIGGLIILNIVYWWP